MAGDLGTGQDALNRPVFRFGEFALFAAQRRLEQDGIAVRIGARAFDILTLLLERAGTPVTKREIADRVWPDVTVGESSLRFQMVALRRLLGDGAEDGASIATLPGRGYSFVAPVRRIDRRTIASDYSRRQRPPLPASLARMVGRETELRAVLRLLGDQRFVTLLGPGGIGKTTLALSAAHELAADFDGDVCFVDLAAIDEPEQVAVLVADALRLPVSVCDPSPAIVSALRDRRSLILLDSCEHVVGAVAELAEHVFLGAPDAHLLATSREALRVEGERILPIDPLPYPGEGEAPTSAELLGYPAARLLVERAAAAGSPLTLSDDDVPIVAEICRQVDGIALALEIAAGRIPSYGLRGTLTLLEDRFRFLKGGRRTAVPRHRTLADTLAWSYDLLDPEARTTLHRLSVLVGDFDLDAAVAVANARPIGREAAIEAVGSLASKSLLSVKRTGQGVRYRLLDTTRAYAFGKLVESGEAAETARRHAGYFAGLLAHPDGDLSPNAFVSNMRAALEWCFGEGEDPATGLALAAGACPLFLARSLLTDCVRFSRAALAVMNEAQRRERIAMVLQTCLGQSLMFTSGNTAEAERALDSALALAERYGDVVRRLKLTGALHIFHERTGAYFEAFEFAERGQAIAEEIGDPAAIAAAHSLLGIACHLMGRHADADRHLELALDDREGVLAIDPTGFGFNHRNRARITMARSHFLQGRPDMAAALARDAVAEARALGHPVTYAIAMIWSGSIAVWRQDWVSVEEHAARFLAHAERYSLNPYPSISLGSRGIMAIHTGRPLEGVAMIVEAMAAMRAARYELVNTELSYHLAEGYRRLGRLDEALAEIVAVEALVARQGDMLYLPEILRTKGDILSSCADGRHLADEAFDRSVACAQEQGALAWELRAAVSLARHMTATGRAAAGRRLLGQVHGRFVEGFGTGDLREARALLGGPTRQG